MPRSISSVPTVQNVSDARRTTPGRRSPQCRSINGLLPSANGSTTKCPGGAQGTVGRLPIHDKSSPRFDAAESPELTGKFAEVTLGSHPDPVPGVQGLQPRIEVVKFLDVCAEQPLDPGVGVESGPATPDLYEPRPDLFRRIDFDGVRRLLAAANNPSPGSSRAISSSEAPQRCDARYEQAKRWDSQRGTKQYPGRCFRDGSSSRQFVHCGSPSVFHVDLEPTPDRAPRGGGLSRDSRLLSRRPGWRRRFHYCWSG